MKKARSIIASIILLCLCITGCTDSTTVNTSDFSDAIGDSPEAAVSPSESYIIESLNQSEFILEVEAVTESNDPNGKLNIDGGYNACVFFSSTLVDQSNFSAKSVVEKGTSCGGCIEVYSSEEDATARNEYLAKFDGGLLDSGSHTVIGTIIIRTSEKLTKEQQTELTRNLVSIITSSEQPTDPNNQEDNGPTSSSNDTTSASTAPTSGTPTTEPTTAPTTAPTTEPPHTHSFSAATCTAPKTCSCGATEGEPNGHNWKDANCTTPKSCTSCNITEGTTTEHSWKDATYASPKTCTVCGATEGNPLDVPGKENYHGHVYTGGDKSTKYHYEADCAGKYSHEITWEEVDRRGLEPCGTCVLK